MNINSLQVVASQRKGMTHERRLAAAAGRQKLHDLDFVEANCRTSRSYRVATAAAGNRHCPHEDGRRIPLHCVAGTGLYSDHLLGDFRRLHSDQHVISMRMKCCSSTDVLHTHSDDMMHHVYLSCPRAYPIDPRTPLPGTLGVE